jgi:hypothetical protein
MNATGKNLIACEPADSQDGRFTARGDAIAEGLKNSVTLARCRRRASSRGAVDFHDSRHA